MDLSAIVRCGQSYGERFRCKYFQHDRSRLRGSLYRQFVDLYRVNKRLQDLARTLHHTLMSAILDCTSTMASCDASLPEVEVDLIDVVEDIIQGIYGTIFHQSVPVGHADYSSSVVSEQVRSFRKACSTIRLTKI